MATELAFQAIPMSPLQLSSTIIIGYLLTHAGHSVNESINRWVTTFHEGCEHTIFAGACVTATSPAVIDFPGTSGLLGVVTGTGIPEREIVARRGREDPSWSNRREIGRHGGSVI